MRNTLLAENNAPEWMKENASDVRRHLKDPFVAYLNAATVRLEEEEIQLRGGVGTVFRMRRDARFQGAAKPFHDHLNAVLSTDGRRIGTRASIHVSLARSGSFLRAGSFLLCPAARRALRE